MLMLSLRVGEPVCGGSDEEVLEVLIGGGVVGGELRLGEIDAVEDEALLLLLVISFVSAKSSRRFAFVIFLLCHIKKFD